MGIFINLSISKSVTKNEWERVYEETLELVKVFPFAERRKVACKGIETICLVPSAEREQRYGWNNEKTRWGWFADGDFETLHTAEEYALYRELIKESEVESDAGDALLGALPAYTKFQWDDPRCAHIYDIWGAKTQGEPYHMYLLAVACLIEVRLGEKAFVYGDITRGQCKKAVELANKYLVKPIKIPDRCDMERFYRRVSKLELSEEEQFLAFEGLYLGTKDSEYGEYIRGHYSEDVLDQYWKDSFQKYYIGTKGFDDHLNEYLLWGFDLGKLCRMVNYNDKDNIAQYEKFVQRILDAKLYLKHKDCEDILKIDQEESEPYSIYTLMAQFVFLGAGNKRVDRYIPIDELKKILVDELNGKCNVEAIIEEYLQNDGHEEDTSDVLKQAMDVKKQDMIDTCEKYDITTHEDLIYYETGDSIEPKLLNALKKSFAFYDSIAQEDFYKELMNFTAKTRCRWLVDQNKTILIRKQDWIKIFTDIKKNKSSFSRYYPMMRLKLEHNDLIYMTIAIVLNDDLYAYCKDIIQEAKCE